MFRRLTPLASCLLLALTLCAQGQEPIPLAQDETYQNGLTALSDELPELAISRLEKALENRANEDPARATIQLHLMEAYIRASQIESALPLFDLPALAGNEVALFWKARAQVVLGHYFEATNTLGQLAGAEDPVLRNTAALARARLLASLGDRKESLLLLQSMAEDDQLTIRNEAKLLLASIHLDSGTLDQASALLETIDPEIPRLAPRRSYLLARLALAQHNDEEAAELFRALVDDPEYLTRPLYIGSILGHADALHALDRKDDAVTFLLTEIDKTSPTGYLEQFFTRLVNWSSGNDSLRKLLQDRLVAWAAPPAGQGDPVLRSLDDPVANALASSWSANAPPVGLRTFALYHQALFLTQKNTPESVYTAKRLLARLRLENPTHPLARESLLETSLLHLGENRRAEALGTLEVLESLAEPGNLKAEAAELAARVRFSDEDYAGAADAFSRARTSLASDGRRFTAINQGLAQLMSDDQEGFSTLLSSLDDEEAILSLELERALLSASRRDASAKALLDQFLQRHPGHLRAPEARLALAELSLFTDSRDLSMALAQLDSIDSAVLSDRAALRYLLARLKLGELSGDWNAAIAEATSYLRNRQTPEQAAVLLKLGEAFYLNGNYGEARIQFLQVAKLETASAHHEVARFYAAKAGLRVGTPEAGESALALLQQVANENGPLAVEARLQLGRSHLDNGQPDLALAELAPILTEDAEHAARIDALIMAAEAHRTLGTPDHFNQCLSIYDELLKRQNLPYVLNNRIHYLKGHTLEQLEEPARALDCYYRVIRGENRPKNTPITEWKWFYTCGFRALQMLEDGKSWLSAIAVARILSNTDGHLADKARIRADKLELEHMYWEEE